MAHQPTDSGLFPEAFGSVMLVSSNSFKIVKELKDISWRTDGIFIRSAATKGLRLGALHVLYDGMRPPEVTIARGSAPELARYETDHASARATRDHFSGSDAYIREVRRAIACGGIRQVALSDASLWKACEAVKQGRDGHLICQATVYVSELEQEGGPERTGDKKIVGLILVWVSVEEKPDKLLIERVMPSPGRQIELELSVSPKPPEPSRAASPPSSGTSPQDSRRGSSLPTLIAVGLAVLVIVAAVTVFIIRRRRA